MSFAADMKDFVSAFKTGSDVGNSIQKVGQTNRALDQTDRRLDQYDDATKAKKDDPESIDNVASRYTNSDTTATPGSGKKYTPPEDVKKTIDANVPEDMRDYAYNMAAKESSYNPNAVSKTGAKGLFQFTSGTGARFGLNGPEGDRRTDPVANTKAFVDLTNQNRDYLTKKLGRPPTWSELAVAHQQGAQGAYNLITGKGPVNANNMAVNNAHGINDITKYYALPNGNSPAVAQQPTRAIPAPQTVASNDDDDEEDGYARGGMVRGYADGGLVNTNDDPNDQSNNQYYAQEAARTQALPTPSAPAPAPQSAAPQPAPQPAPQQTVPVGSPEQKQFTAIGDAAPDQDNPLMSAIKGGLKTIQAHFTPQQAVQGRDDGGAARLFTTTEGAGDHQSVIEMEKAVDPKGQMPEGMARVYGLTKAYEYFTAKGDLKKADQAAASIIRYSQVQAQALGAQAVDAINKGDMAGAQKYLVSAYNQIPDGLHATLENNQIILRDSDGKTQQALPAPGPGQVLQMAKAAQDGSGYYQMLLNTISKGTAKAPSGPSPAFQQYAGGATPAGNQPQQQAAPAQQDPAQPPAQTPDQSAPAQSGAPTQVASNTPATPTQNDASTTADVPKSFMPQKVTSAIPAKPVEPNIAAMDPKERPGAIALYKSRKADYDAAVKAAASKDADPDYDAYSKGVSKAFNNYITENTPDDPKVGKGPEFSAKDKLAIRELGTHIQAHNPNVTAEQAVEAALSLTTIDKDNPAKLNFDFKKAGDGSMAVRLQDGTPLILSPDAARRLAQTVDRKREFIKSEKAKADEAAKPSPAMQKIKAGAALVGEGFAAKNPDKEKAMAARATQQQANRDSGFGFAIDPQERLGNRVAQSRDWSDELDGAEIRQRQRLARRSAIPTR